MPMRRKHPSDRRRDHVLSLRESGPGLYEASAPGVQDGGWEMAVEAKAGDYADYPLPDTAPEPAEAAAEQDAGQDGLPKGNASGEEWAAYGLRHGLTAEQVTAMTRDELRAHFTQEVTGGGD